MANIGYQPVNGFASGRILKIFIPLYLLYVFQVPTSALEELSPSEGTVQVSNSPSPLLATSQHTVKRRLHFPTAIQNKPLLPRPTNFTVRSVNPTQVQLSWSYNSSELLSPRLQRNLFFVLQVQESSKGSFSAVRSLQGHVRTFVYSLLRFRQYRFRVVAASLGLTNASDATEWVFGGLGLQGPPTALRASRTSSAASSVRLVWKNPSPDAVCSVYWSTDARSLMTQHEPLLTDCAKEHFTVRNVKPNLTYYFCVSGFSMVESVCSEVAKVAPSSSSSTTLSARISEEKVQRVKRVQKTVFAKIIMHQKPDVLGTVLPQVTDLTVRSVNASHVQLSWAYNYSLLSPKTLYNNLSFEVQVAQGDSSFHTVALLPAAILKFVFVMGGSFEQYRFRVVTASSGLRNASSPTDAVYSGLYPSGPPSHLRVLARNTFSMSLEWDKRAPQSYLVVIYWSSTLETLMVQNEPLYVDDIHNSYPVTNLNPGQKYYFCVSLFGLIETICSNVVSASTLSPNLTSVSMVDVSSAGLRSLRVTWQEPTMPKGLAIHHYLVYTSLSDKFDRGTANTTTCSKSPCVLSEGLEELGHYTIVVTYLAVKQGSAPQHWSEEGPLSTPVVFSLPPDAQSVLLVCESCEPVSSEEVKLHWTANGVQSTSDLSKYGFRMLIRDSTIDSFLVNTTLPETPYIVLGGLNQGVLHRFTLQLRDNLGYKGNVSACQSCLPKEIAPTAAPANVAAVSGDASSSHVNISWSPLPPESRGGVLEYEVHVKAHLCSDHGGSAAASTNGSCSWCAEGGETVQSTASLSLAVNLEYGRAYQVRVRGVTGVGTLYGPYSQPFCFQTPKQVPKESPAVKYFSILDQAVCVKWTPLTNTDHFIKGYQIEVDAVGSSGGVESRSRTAYNVTSDMDHYVVPVHASPTSHEHSFSVRGYSATAFGPRSPSVKFPFDDEQSVSEVSISASPSVADPCGRVSLEWKVPPNNTCGWYSTSVTFYPKSVPAKSLTLVENSPANRMDINTSSLDANLEYTFKVNVRFVSYDGAAVYESVAVAMMAVPNCSTGAEVTTVLVGLAVSIIAILCAIVVVVFTILICRNRYRSRPLRDLPRSRYRIEQRLNPYIDYPQHPHARRHSSSELDSVVDYESEGSQTSLLGSHTSTASDQSMLSGLSAEQSNFAVSDYEPSHTDFQPQYNPVFMNADGTLQNPSLLANDNTSSLPPPTTSDAPG